MPTKNTLSIIGTVDKLDETVLAYGADGGIRTLKVGDPIFQGDTIHVLSPTGNAAITLNDGTPFF